MIDKVGKDMNLRRKRKSNHKLQKIIVGIVAIFLLTTLVITFKNYRVSIKKIQARDIMREFILTVETAELRENITFDGTETIASLKNNKEKYNVICKYCNVDDFEKIENLTLDETRRIINNEVDFRVNKDGKVTGEA